jgi:DNA-binding transcriptional LysR family regulator
LTEAGAQLREYAENYLEGLDVLLENLDRQTQSLNGPVRYGMPASCLKTPHFPILLEKRVDFLEVEINISILSNEEIFDEITEGNLDFGFVTKKSPRGGFDYIDFAKESYVLVGSPELIDDFNEETPFIDYPGMGVLLEYWRQNYFPRKRNLNEHNVFKAGSINDLDAAILMCTMGMGVSIFPLHCVDILIYEGELNAYTRKGKSDPTESIYIVSKKERTKPRRVERVIQTFLEMK